jgi:hypothetical protein
LIKGKRNYLGPTHLTSLARGHPGPPGHFSSAPARPCTRPKRFDRAPMPFDHTPRPQRGATVKPTGGTVCPGVMLIRSVRVASRQRYFPVSSHISPKRSPHTVSLHRSPPFCTSSRRCLQPPVWPPMCLQAFPVHAVLERQVAGT